MEAAGRKFYNSNGAEQDCIQVLKDKGINSIRLRVWVNPAAGWCSVNDVVTQAVRAKNMGMRVMIDFHYSDSWADPGQQTKPAAWTTLDFNGLLTAVYNHTYDALTLLKANSVTPEWVQVGNETNNGMLWEDGKASVNMNNFARLVTSGYNAVKAVDSSTKVIVHLSNGYDNSLFRWMFDGLKNNAAKWDVIGMSLYPTQSNWATLNNQCLNNMNDMVARYGKEIMISEVGMDVGPAPTVKAFLTDLIGKTRSLANSKGLGVFYWEPQSYNNWQGYTKGAFDMTGKPTVAIDAFLENPLPPPVTNFATNGSFEVNGTGAQTPTGWSESGTVTASYTSAGNGWNPAGSYFLNHYDAAAYQVRTFQTVSLPNGHYTLKAWAIRGNGQNSVQMTATGYGGADLSANITYNNAWSEVNIPDINITNGQVTIGFLSDANAGNWLNVDSITLTTLTALPVSLVSYVATLQPGGQVRLNWKTASEINNKNYSIERSINGINYTEISWVQGRGNTSVESQYEFVDHSPAAGQVNYYRLTQFNIDGRSTVLGVKAINVKQPKSNLSVYPNPVVNTMRIVSGDFKGQKVAFTLIGGDGKKVLNKQLVPTTNEVRLSVAGISSGQYFLLVTGDNINETRKVFIK